jgi:DNA-binding response OmpR family regulator
MKGTRVRILCIEDNPMNWRLVQRLLSLAGYEMHWAEDGLKGCEMALALKPALILLDLNLPGLSGFEVATKLRQYASMDATRIVALTAKTLRSDRETALVTGCDGFIPKPIDPFLFVEQVEAYLGGQKDQLEQGREGAALRQFSQQVVEHLEAQLKEAQEGNRKLLDVQVELEQRSHHLSRLLSLSKEVIPAQSESEILARVTGQLYQELHLHRLSVYRMHESGSYLQGTVLRTAGFEEPPVLPGSHPLVAALSTLPVGSVLLGENLQLSPAWQHGIEVGLWGPKHQALVLPLHSRAEEHRFWGFLAADRLDRSFQPFEMELAALHAGILHASLENAGLIAHLAETSQALSASYEGLESAYESMQEAQRALSIQDRRAALGTLFMNMAHRILLAVGALKDESEALTTFLCQLDFQSSDRRNEGLRSLDQVHNCISQVEGLVRALLRRAGESEATSPEWIHLHELLFQELELLRAEGVLPESLPVELNFQAPRDLLYGVYADFSKILRHLLEHALVGGPGRILLRTAGAEDRFQMEMEDDGAPIDALQLERALEPHPDLLPAIAGHGRRPGQGLPSCAQLATAYNGQLQLVPKEQGSLLRIALPLE